MKIKEQLNRQARAQAARSILFNDDNADRYAKAA